MKLKNKKLSVSVDREEPRKHLAQLTSLYEKAYSDFPQYSYNDLEDVFDYLNGMIKDDNKYFLSAQKAGGKIIGFVIAEKRPGFTDYPVGEIHEIVVDPDYQRQGLGNELFDLASELLENTGCKRLELCVGRNNSNAISFYIKKGMKKVREEKRWVYMEKHF